MPPSWNVLFPPMHVRLRGHLVEMSWSQPTAFALSDPLSCHVWTSLACNLHHVEIAWSYVSGYNWTCHPPEMSSFQQCIGGSEVTWSCAGLSQLHLLFLTPSHVWTSSSSILHQVEIVWSYVHKWLACSCTDKSGVVKCVWLLIYDAE